MRELQSKFAHLVIALLTKAESLGYEITLGEAWRSTETAALDAQEGKGINHSLHIQRLAIDLNLFEDGNFLISKNDYQSLGDYWKTLDPMCFWGGDFISPDSDHFSLSPDGGRTK